MAEFKLKQTAEEVQRAMDNALSFGDSPTGGDTLYWDGNTEGLVNVDGVYYKVSDTFPTLDELSLGATLSGAGQTAPVEFEELISGLIVENAGYLVWIVAENAVGVDIDGLIFPEAGTYFANEGGVYMSSLTIPGYTGFPVTKKMEEKYLPGAVILYEDGTYLYNTEDVSDASNRTSYAKFKGALQNGIPIYICVGGFMYALATKLALADGFGVMVIDDGERYTAEYVPE